MAYIDPRVTAAKERNQKYSGKSIGTRFLAWLNGHLNPMHNWIDYDSAPDAGHGALENFAKQTFGTGLTDRDIQLNAMNMQNVEDTAVAQVAGYRKAGINPALMYGAGGQQSAPQTSGSAGSGSLSDLMQIMMLPAQIKLMNAQAKNTEANTQKQISETEQIKQVMQFYPRLTEHTIAEITSRTGVNLQNISESEARTEVLAFEKIIKGSEAKYSEEFYKLRNRVEEATELNAKASALNAYMQALWTEYETQYTREHDGARPSSSSLLALADAVMSWLGTDGKEVGGKLTQTINDTVAEISGKKPTDGSTMQDLGRGLAGNPWKIKGKTIVEHGKAIGRRFKRFLHNNDLKRF